MSTRVTKSQDIQCDSCGASKDLLDIEIEPTHTLWNCDFITLCNDCIEDLMEKLRKLLEVEGQ